MPAAGALPPACFRHGGEGAALSTRGAAPVPQNDADWQDVNGPLDVPHSLAALCLKNCEESRGVARCSSLLSGAHGEIGVHQHAFAFVLRQFFGRDG